MEQKSKTGFRSKEKKMLVYSITAGGMIEVKILAFFVYENMNLCLVYGDKKYGFGKKIVNYETGGELNFHFPNSISNKKAIAMCVNFIDSEKKENQEKLQETIMRTKNTFLRINKDFNDSFFLENDYLTERKSAKKIKQKLMFLYSEKETKSLAVVKKIVPYKIKHYEFNLALTQNVFGHTHFVEYATGLLFPIGSKMKNESLAKYTSRFFVELENLIKKQGEDLTIEKMQGFNKINFGAEPNRDDVRFFVKETLNDYFGIGLTYFKHIFYTGAGKNKRIDYELVQECIDMDETCFACLPKQIKADKDVVKMYLRKNLLMITNLSKIKEIPEVALHAIKSMSHEDKKKQITLLFAEIAQITEQEATEIIDGDFYDLSIALMNFKVKGKKLNRVKKEIPQINCACCSEKITEQKENYCKSCFKNLDDKVLNLEVKIEELEEKIEEFEIKAEQFEEKIEELEAETQKSDIVLKIEENLKKQMYITNDIQEYCIAILTGEIEQDDLRAFLNNKQ